MTEAITNSVTMYCDVCGDDRAFSRELRDGVVDVRGESITVPEPLLVCTQCGAVQPDLSGSVDSIKLANDEYRRRHGLLSGEEIRHIREQYDLSREAFAAVLGMSPATLYRYEAGAIQDDVQDSLIFACDDLATMRRLARRKQPKLSAVQWRRFEAALERTKEARARGEEAMGVPRTAVYRQNDDFRLGKDSEIMKVAEQCEWLLHVATARLGDEFYYQSLPLCVIDAVFSINARYEAVQNTVSRYCQTTKQKRNRPRNGALPPPSDQEAISRFCSRQTDPVQVAESVYGNRQRTSPTNGILKADAALRFARCLEKHGVQYLQDVSRIANDAQFEKEVKEIPGQSSGVMLSYFLMLSGSDDFVKPDRHLRGFLESILGRKVPVPEAIELVTATCRSLKTKYPNITPRLLDYEIWKYQRARNCTGARQASAR